MPPTPAPAPRVVPRSAAEVNARIRALSAGRAVWTPAALAELGRLQAEWRVAVEQETRLAA